MPSSVLPLHQAPRSYYEHPRADVVAKLPRPLGRVLDVGCGTGILSLFAARSGAKRVFAVDASEIALKAEQIVKANGYEEVVTVIRGKVEDIQLPDGIEKVDIIISEWMGYALLYESMLDSVLRARDRFQPKVMAPSQCQMMLALCDGDEVYKERIEFWNDVYGACNCSSRSTAYRLCHRPRHVGHGRQHLRRSHRRRRRPAKLAQRTCSRQGKVSALPPSRPYLTPT